MVAVALIVLDGIAHARSAGAEVAALYEEGQGGQSGKRSAGSVAWRTEKEPTGAGRAPSLAVRADIEIPQRRMAASWVLHRNADRSLPATHTIDIVFKLPPDFGGSIANIPRVLMKPTEQARGAPLAGITVKVADNVFLIGLSALPRDAPLDEDILRDGQWIDILILYANGGRAILSVEKGPSGNSAFADAFAAWKK